LPLMQSKSTPSLGVFMPGEQVDPGPSLVSGLRRINQPLYLLSQDCESRIMTGTAGTLHESVSGQVFSGMAMACPLHMLGDADFCRDHAIRFPYVGGSMAKGISSVAMVEALAHAGMLGFFGAAGLLIEDVEVAIDRLESSSAGLTYGFNLIHSPNEPELENALIDTVMAGGDSAARAMTAGMLLGACHGRKNIPDRWLQKLNSYKRICSALDQLP